MRTTAGAGLAGALVASVLAAPTVASAAPMEIVAGKNGVVRIGSFRPADDARLRAARRAFGQPRSVRETERFCTAKWELGLKLTFVVGENSSESPCGAGRAETFKASGRRFVTWRGLRIGAPERAVLRHHPNARKAGVAWRLRRTRRRNVRSQILATIKREHVRAFAGYVGPRDPSRGHQLDLLLP